MFDETHNNAVAEKFSTEPFARWMDLSPAGMKLMMAIHRGGRRLVIENGDKNPEAMKQLGFKSLNNGYWFNDDVSFKPNLMKKFIPGATTDSRTPISQIILDLTEAEVVNSSEARASMANTFDADAAVFIGYNRLGEEVYEEAGGKRKQHTKRNIVKEGSGAATIPAHFLRAVDENQLAACADGYVYTVRYVPEYNCSKPDVFMKSIGLDPSKDDHKFADAVLAAGARFITKENKETLNIRYEKAVDITKKLNTAGFSTYFDLSSVVLARRLLGSDRDLRGESIFQIGGDETLLQKIIPASGCRRGDDNQTSSVVVNFARTPQELADVLDQRPSKGRTISVLKIDTEKKARAIIDAVSQNNQIEAAGIIPETDGKGVQLIVSSISTQQPSTEYEVRILDKEGEIWTWASTVAASRSHAVETLKSGVATEDDFNSASAFIVDNSYQIAYNSASKVGKPTTLVPKELSAATRVALDRIISNYPDIDEKVAYEIGFHKDELGKYLVAEQVDGVALMINAQERGRGVVIGDGTGVGKGRQIMAMVRRAVLSGHRVMIFSESAANLADLMRDAKHLNSLDIIKPLVINNDKLIDEQTKEEFETVDRAVLEKSMEENKWPDNVQVIMSTYSQFNRSKEDSKKTQWLLNIIDERVALFGDEIHNAASINSNISNNYSALKAEVRKNGGQIVSASATYAKDPKNIAFFSEMFPADINMDELQSMMIKGGESFQEVVSDMLTADGVFFRRETDLSDIEFVQLVDKERLNENRTIADKLSVIVASIAEISGSVEDAVDEINRREGTTARKDGLRKAALGSSLYHVTRLLNAALLAPFTADKAIEELKAGNKPGFLLENTVGELLEEARRGSGDAPTFRDVLNRVLNQLVGGGRDRSDEVLNLLQQNSPEAFDAYNTIKALIEDFPPIEASVIDTIKNRIIAAGYTIGEITGRSLEVNSEGKVVPRKERNKMITKNAFNSGEIDCVIMNATGATGMDLHAGRRFKDRRRRVLFEVQGPANVLKQIQAYGRYSRRDQESAPKIAFVASGLPFEARLAAMRNQKLRRLSANVQSNRDNTFLMGNIPDLINQVGDAVITKYAELRPDLLHRLVLFDKYAERTKLVDVAQEVSVYQQEPERNDELAPYDPAQARQAQQQEAQGFRRGGVEQMDQRSANEFLSRLSLLPCREQERILRELTAEYEMHVAELDSLGVNPLRPREFDGTVRVTGSDLYEGSIDSGANSAFEAPMYLMKAQVEREVEPMTSEVVIAELDTATARYERIQSKLKEVVRNRDKYLQHFLKDGVASVEDAIAGGDNKIKSMAKDIEHLEIAIEAFAPGRQIKFMNADGVIENAIIASIEEPWEGAEHLIASYRMKIAIPGHEKLKEYGVETVLRNHGVSSLDANGNLKIAITEGLLGNDYDKILTSFDKAPRRRLENALFLVGNVFRAVRYATQFRLGSLVSFIDEKGYRHRGVLINKQAENKLKNIAVRIEGIEAAKAALKQDIEINSSPTGTGRNFVITPMDNDTYAVRLPDPYVRNKVRQWPSEEYRELYMSMMTPDFDMDAAESRSMSKAAIKKAAAPRALIHGERQLDHVLNVVQHAGITSYYVNPKYRDKVSAKENSGAQWTPETTGMKL